MKKDEHGFTKQEIKLMKHSDVCTLCKHVDALKSGESHNGVMFRISILNFSKDDFSECKEVSHYEACPECAKKIALPYYLLDAVEREIKANMKRSD